MIRYATLFVLIFSVHSIQSMVQVGVDEGPEDDYYDDGNGYWEGPGFYYGVWFDNEAEYNDWRHGHSYRGRPHYHGHGDRNHYHGGGHRSH